LCFHSRCIYFYNSNHIKVLPIRGVIYFSIQLLFMKIITNKCYTLWTWMNELYAISHWIEKISDYFCLLKFSFIPSLVKQ
jgi:hypothetical protein